MARTPTERPLTEHLTTLSRMLGQVSVTKKMSAARRTRVKKLLSEVMTELQDEVTKK